MIENKNEIDDVTDEPSRLISDNMGVKKWRLLSFDIGIKNMAYCFLSVSGEHLEILDWNILNLMDTDVQAVYTCICPKTQPKKSKTVLENMVLCSKKAKYSYPDGSGHLCETHAKKSANYLMPTKDISPASIKKLKVAELDAVSKKYGLSGGNSKKETLEKLLEHLSQKTLKPILVKKKKTASETDLITVGRNMTRLLDQLAHQDVTHVIVENQISTIASRMKTIQGMLAQYYIMRGIEKIEFVSSFNKLKAFTEKTAVTDDQTEREKYKNRKADSVAICLRILRENPNLEKWIPHFEKSAKKDDLADCFLQGGTYGIQNPATLDSSPLTPLPGTFQK
jgi:hypothetical protein